MVDSRVSDVIRRWVMTYGYEYGHNPVCKSTNPGFDSQQYCNVFFYFFFFFNQSKVCLFPNRRFFWQCVQLTSQRFRQSSWRSLARLTRLFYALFLVFIHFTTTATLHCCLTSWFDILFIRADVYLYVRLNCSSQLFRFCVTRTGLCAFVYFLILTKLINNNFFISKKVRTRTSKSRALLILLM